MKVWARTKTRGTLLRGIVITAVGWKVGATDNGCARLVEAAADGEGAAVEDVA
jgi:hypothetical protein